MLSAQDGDQNNAEVEGIGKACCFEPFAQATEKNLTRTIWIFVIGTNPHKQ